MKRSSVLWTLAIILTVVSAIWQRWSGPTYSVHFRDTVGGVEVSGKLLRTHSITGDLPVTIRTAPEGAEDPGVSGAMTWRRYPTNDPWETTPLPYRDGALRGMLPRQGMAGKIEYWVEVTRDGESFRIPQNEAAVARFKGDVPAVVLIIHILFMFFGMAWSTRAGLEALAGGPKLQRHSLVALVLLAVGGFVLGPIVQKYAFDAYWTGWPLGEDLTDNKLALAVLVWALAARFARRAEGPRARGRWWAVAAMLIVFAVFSIPHSMHGSTLDYETGQHIQTASAMGVPDPGNCRDLGFRGETRPREPRFDNQR